MDTTETFGSVLDGLPVDENYDHEIWNRLRPHMRHSYESCWDSDWTGNVNDRKCRLTLKTEVDGCSLYSASHQQKAREHSSDKAGYYAAESTFSETMLIREALLSVALEVRTELLLDSTTARDICLTWRCREQTTCVNGGSMYIRGEATVERATRFSFSSFESHAAIWSTTQGKECCCCCCCRIVWGRDGRSCIRIHEEAPKKQKHRRHAPSALDKETRNRRSHRLKNASPVFDDWMADHWFSSGLPWSHFWCQLDIAATWKTDTEFAKTSLTNIKQRLKSNEKACSRKRTSRITTDRTHSVRESATEVSLQLWLRDRSRAIVRALWRLDWQYTHWWLRVRLRCRSSDRLMKRNSSV